jgi:ferritin-like metal-binding protein YciE
VTLTIRFIPAEALAYQQLIGGFVTRDKNEAINSYISDMLALEDHIEKAIRGQLEDLKDYPEVTAELRQIHRKVEHHISDLKGLSERRKASGVKETVKRAGSAVLGAAAAAIDLVRTEGLPKNLRDDYTALSLASVGYTMLHTTGLSLGDQEAADLARQGFSDYAEAVTRLQAIIPAAVVAFFKQEGLPAREDVIPEVRRTIEEVWQNQSSGVVRTDAAAVGRGIQS